LLSAQTLLHRYSFVSDASDSVGTANGTIVAPKTGGAATISNGLSLPGSGGGFGTSGYVSLPAGILTATTNLTVEVWVTQNSANTWGTPWDFGNNGSQNFALIPSPGNNNHNMEVAFTPNNGEEDLQSGTSFPNGVEQYVSVTYNNATLAGNIYLNGVLDASTVFSSSAYCPGTIGGSGGTTENMLGNDVYGDPQFSGTVYEFRIWNGVVSQRYLEASAIVGPSVLINNLTPTSLSLSAGPAVVVTGTEQASVDVTLAQTGTNELAANSDATWTSANTNVVTVNSSGFITGVGVGTTTVSATIGGVTSTTGSITVTPQALAHRYSFVSDATDSVGGANGTLVAPNGGAAASIANGLILPGNTHGGNGYSGYVSLPQGVLTNTTSITVECWLTQNQANTWAQAWDFGINNQAYNFALIPYPANNNGNVEVANFNNNANLYISSAAHFPNNAEQYVAVTFNDSSLIGSIYTNGVLDATENYPSTAYAPGSYGAPGGTVNNYLGNDIYGDDQFDGTIYELRIWNGAVTPLYLALSTAAGPAVVITNTTPQSLNVVLTETSMLGSGTQQASVTGNFLQIAGVPVTTAVTKWTSSNTNILTVSSSGLITALSGGSATVSATVNGVTAASPSITVQNTAPTITQRPVSQSVIVSASVTFSVGALGGNLSYQWSFGSTPIIGATNSSLTLNNLTVNQTGTYNVLVSNNLGTTNLAATLAVSGPVLQHRYSFVSDASDSVGGANGTIVPPSASGSAVTIANGLVLPGGGGGGYSGYVTLPSGILTNTTSLTVEVWVTQNTANGWATVWDFANNTSQNFELCPNPQRGINNLDAAIEPNSGEIDTVTSALFPSGVEQYVAFTFNASTLTADIYTNALLGATEVYPNSSYIPGTIGGAAGTAVNALGNDIFNDAQFQGTIYEFRIWNGPVSPLYLAVSEAAGPSIVVTNTTPSSFGISVPSTLTPGTTQAATVVANFPQVSGVAANSFVTAWSSSNTNVLTVNASGVITAVNTGSATISATVNGSTGTSSSIIVPATAPQITQQPTAAVTLLTGGTLSASVSVIGSLPLTYTWYLNNSSTPISGATSSTLTVPNVQLANAGSYTVAISNSSGGVVSSPEVVTVVAPTAYQSTLIGLNPLGYWPLNETSGTVAYDLAGGDNGTYIGGCSLGQGGPPNASFGANSYSVSFDGTSGYVDIPEGPFNITGAITTMIWINDQYTYTFDGIFGHGDPSWRMSVDPSTTPGANDGTSAAFDATSLTPINDGNWHFVVYTYTGAPGVENNGTLYVDGVVAAHNTVETTPTGDALDVWIGGSPDYPTARLTEANLADAAVFDYALTANEVQDVFNASPLPVLLTIAPAGKNVVLTWPSGTLLQSTNVAGPWTSNASATSPYTVPATNALQFFKVQVSP